MVTRAAIAAAMYEIDAKAGSFAASHSITFAPTKPSDVTAKLTSDVIGVLCCIITLDWLLSYTPLLGL